jgi:hypothetical protein
MILNMQKLSDEQLFSEQLPLFKYLLWRIRIGILLLGTMAYRLGLKITDCVNYLLPVCFSSPEC